MQITPRYPAETAREYAYRTLRDNIVGLQLEPGKIVSEKDLAQQLGLSRTPVREALIELSRSGIVEIFPQQGCGIAKIDYEVVEEVRFLRLTLEKAMVEMACEPTIEKDLTRLRENVHLQEYYLENPVSSERMMELDNEFHRELFVICGKLRIYNLMTSMTTHFDRLRNVALRTIAERSIIHDHQVILQAIEECDAPKGLAMITHHLSRYKTEESELRKQHPQYFK